MPATPSAQHHFQLVQAFEPQTFFVGSAYLFETIPISIPAIQHSVSVPPFPMTVA